MSCEQKRLEQAAWKAGASADVLIGNVLTT